MPQVQTQYWIMVKPLHPVYGFPVPGFNRLSRVPDGIEPEEIETFYFRKYVVSCGGGCPWEIYPVKQPVFGLFEVCYSIHELRRAYRRALKIWGESNIQVLQRVSHDVIIKNN